MKSLLGVLVAISIPIFTSQLEKSREATDEANLRSTYAEVMAAVLSETDAGTTDSGVTITVANGVVTASKSYTTKQTVAGWSSDEKPIIGDITLTDDEAPVKGAVQIQANSNGYVKIGSVEKNAD